MSRRQRRAAKGKRPELPPTLGQRVTRPQVPPPPPKRPPVRSGHR